MHYMYSEVILDMIIAGRGAEAASQGALRQVGLPPLWAGVHHRGITSS
jgi:hypothetical protein